MGYAISEIGADHLVLANPEGIPFKNARPLEITEAQPVSSLNEEKMRQFYVLEKV